MHSLTNHAQTFLNGFFESTSDSQPHKLCAYIYEVSNAFNSFYHETKILSEADADRKQSFIQLLKLTERILSTSIDLLGFSAPERM